MVEVGQEGQVSIKRPANLDTWQDLGATCQAKRW